MKIRKLLSRYVANIVAAMMLFVTSSCGGGGGGSSPSGSNTGTLRPNVVAVPFDGSVTLSNITSSSVTLSGKVPTLKVGQVIIGGPAPGIMRKINSVTQSGGSTILETTDATLTDAFQTLNISFAGTLAAQPGLKPAKSITETSSGGGTIDPTTITLAAGVTVSISGGIALSFQPGDCVITLNKDNSYVRFAPSVTGKLKVTATASAAASIAFAPYHYQSFPFSPIFFNVAGAPFWITPTIDLYLKADGQVTAGVSVQSSSSVTVSAGIQFQNGTWSKVATYKQQFDVTPTISAAADATCNITPVNANLTVLLDGVGGPFINADLPQFTFGLHSSAPNLTVDATFDGTVGLQVNAFGFNATAFPYSFTSPTYRLYPPSTSYTYNYTGKPFTTFSGSLFKASDHVTISLVTNAPLPANTPYLQLIPDIGVVGQISPLIQSISISDGENTGMLSSGSIEISVGTDANGSIKSWYVIYETLLGVSPSAEISSGNNLPLMDYVEDIASNVPNGSHGSGADNLQDAGSWSGPIIGGG
jgi:hypothetical protein